MSQIKIANIKHGTMEYACFGNGKKTLILLAGVSVSKVTDAAEAIAAQYAVFAEDYTIYVPERREIIPEGFTAEDNAEDIAEWMEQLYLSHACVAGMSWGGMVGMTLAIRHPELVDKLLLTSSSCYAGQTSRELFHRWQSLSASGDQQKLNESFCQDVYSPETTNIYGEQILAQLPVYTPEQLTRFSRQIDAILSTDLREKLPLLKTKTMVIASEGDRVFGAADSRYIAEKLNCPAYFYSEYGHCVYDEAQDFPDTAKRFFDVR